MESDFQIQVKYLKLPALLIGQTETMVYTKGAVVKAEWWSIPQYYSLIWGLGTMSLDWLTEPACIPCIDLCHKAFTVKKAT